jgi:predicted phosphate transport protein (TIGR00153 family)
MPQRKEFYVLLAALSDRVVAGANATLRLLNGLGNNAEDVPTLVAEVSLLEQAGDKIKAEVITLLHRSFTTPINRDQIHALVNELDVVLNALEDVARAVAMYNIKESTGEARELASLGADACMRLNRAVAGLGEKSRRPEVIGFCKEIDEIESKADRVHRKAITSLFDGSGTAWNAVKMSRFYALQEVVLDSCEEAAKTIEEILIENS